MPYGGQIVIKARIADETHLPEQLAPGSYVNLSIVDTGVGMDADTLRRAAEPFFSTKRAGKGLGLGLSMVHGLALQSGGAMQIVSRLGEGTTVLLWFPVAPDRPQSSLTRLFRRSPRRTAGVASFWSTTIRLCSWRPRTCCGSSGTSRSR